MRATRDATTDGSGVRREKRRRLGRAWVTAALVPAMVATLVVMVWLLHDGQGWRRDDNTGASADGTAPVGAGASASARGVGAPAASTLTGDDADQAATPVEAARTAERFAAAWRLAGTAAQRRKALEPVASPYLVSSLTHVSAALPQGREEVPRLLSGSATAALYRIGFSSGEAISVSVDVVGTRWLAVRVNRATTASGSSPTTE
jgi:hypothetical protein